MSEYQYYEWQTVDRPLTQQEQAVVNSLSSHMEVVTSTQAIVTYQWGDFKHDPEKVLLKYFDAFLYYANWGTRRLLFRFPTQSIDVEKILAYCQGESIALLEEGDTCVLSISLGEEGGDYEWFPQQDEDQGGSALSQYLPLREQIMQGDYRALYLAWLKEAVPYGGDSRANDDEDDRDGTAWDGPEPPVPPGLNQLDAALQVLTHFLDLDESLIRVAAQTSGQLSAVDNAQLKAALHQLNRAECEAYLARVLDNDWSVRGILQRRLGELAGQQQPATAPGERAPQELDRLARNVRAEAKKKERAEAERERIAALQNLSKRKKETWASITSLIEEKKPKSYTQAVALLVQLRDLAQYEGELEVFQQQVNAIAGRYASRPALKERLYAAGLIR
jgi:hypothetical protein